MKLSEKAAYLKGLAEGLSLDKTTPEGKLLTAMLDLLGDVTDAIGEIDEDLDIHDVRMVKGPTHTNVIFDCVVPGKLKMTQAELKAAVEALVAKKYPYLCVICFENAYAKVPKEKQ